MARSASDQLNDGFNRLLVSYDPTFKRVADVAKVYYYTNAATTDYFATCMLNGIVYQAVVTGSADVTHFLATYASTAMLMPFEGDIVANAILDATFSQTKYELQDTVAYIGTAPQGMATSAAGWTIERITFDADGNPTAKNATKTLVAVWDNRATETYY